MYIYYIYIGKTPFYDTFTTHRSTYIVSMYMIFEISTLALFIKFIELTDYLCSVVIVYCSVVNMDCAVLINANNVMIYYI